jgi:hypothetical protein
MMNSGILFPFSGNVECGNAMKERMASDLLET